MMRTVAPLIQLLTALRQLDQHEEDTHPLCIGVLIRMPTSTTKLVRRDRSEKTLIVSHLVAITIGYPPAP